MVDDKDGGGAMFGVNGWEIVLLALIAVFVLGPDRLPEYAAKLAHGIRRMRVMAEGAKDQLKDQLGPEYEDINWRQYDPRQYDPRRIVREALLEPLDDAIAPVRDELGSVRSSASPTAGGDAAVGALAAVPAGGAQAPGGEQLGAVPSDPRAWDPARPTPWDVDAT